MMKASDGRWFQVDFCLFLFSDVIFGILFFIQIGVVSFGVPDQQEFDTYPSNI